MGNIRFQHEPTGLVIVQPALEPRPSGVIKIGRWALFYYIRMSCAAIGFDFLTAGVAIHIGPLMFGFVHVEKYLAHTEDA